MSARDIARAHTTTAIIDAAEALLREGGDSALTAGAVAERVGLARNSLYRYVESMDDLRGRVIMRHFPDFLDFIADRVSSASSPEAALSAYVRANLEIAAAENHGWMMSLRPGLSGETQAQVDALHDRLVEIVAGALSPFQPADLALAAELIQGVLSSGFQALERGKRLELVDRYCVAAALAIAVV